MVVARCYFRSFAQHITDSRVSFVKVGLTRPFKDLDHEFLYVLSTLYNLNVTEVPMSNLDVPTLPLPLSNALELHARNFWLYRPSCGRKTDRHFLITKF